MTNSSKLCKLLQVCSLCLLVFVQIEATEIPLDHPNIVYEGSPFIKITRDSVAFPRHTDSVLSLKQWVSDFDGERGKTTTGIALKISTTSPHCEIEFIRRAGYNIFGKFYIRIDREWQPQAVNFSPNGNDKFIIRPEIPPDEAEHLIEIFLPPFANLVLKRIHLTQGHEPLALPTPSQPLYAAIGNSITHGMGQHNTAETFAFQLAEKMDWKLFNFAVGGSTVSTTMATMITDTVPHLDHITILYGYNDFYYAETPLTEFKQELTELIQIYRLAYPIAQIYVISPLVSIHLNSRSGTQKLIDYQEGVDDLVQALILEGDFDLHLIKGRSMTQTSQLSDGIHLSPEGAAMFADSLHVKINSYNDLTHIAESDRSTALKYSLLDRRLHIFEGQAILVNTRGSVLSSKVTHGRDGPARYYDLTEGIYFLKLDQQVEKIIVRPVN